MARFADKGEECGAIYNVGIPARTCRLKLDHNDPHTDGVAEWDDDACERQRPADGKTCCLSHGHKGPHKTYNGEWF